MSWHRRLIAAVLLAIAVLAGLQVVRPPTAAAVPVLVAAADLPAGTRLTAPDLRTAMFAPGTAPRGSTTVATALVGGLLASPVRAGEPITDVRVVGGPLVSTYRALVGDGGGLVALRVSDPTTLTLVRPGDRVDVLAAPTAGSSAGDAAVTVAEGLPVLAVPGAAGDVGSGTSGGLGGTSGAGTGPAGIVVVLASPATARLLARAEVSSQVSVLVHPG